MGPAVERATPRGDGSKKGDAGSEVVEFALVAPLLLLFLLAMIDFGFVFAGLITLRASVEQGARLASVDDYATSAPCSGTTPTAELICKIAARTGSLPGLSGNQLSLGIAMPDGSAAGDEVVVCASTPLRSLTGIAAPFLDGRSETTSSTILLEQTPSFGTYQAGDAPVTAGTQVVSPMTCQ